MIESNFHEQTLRCSVCAEVKEIPRKVLRDPEAVLNMLEDLEHDHRECKANPTNLKLALANRMYRKRMGARAREGCHPARRLTHPGV